MKKLAIALASVLLLSGCSNGGASKAEESFIAGSGAITKMKEGNRIAAPAMSGMTLDGTNFTYTPGKIAVVNVWASWCSPCRAEAPTLVALANKYTDVAFIGILTRDNPVNAEALARRLNIQYPTFIDDALLLGFKSTLPANAIPSTVLIDKNGNVAARISGEVTLTSLSKIIRKLEAE